MLCSRSQNFRSWVPAVDSSHPTTQRRRSERITESLPIVVRGIDLLGQPFEERTATLAFNLHGCRYASKHHLPKNTWLTLELARGSHFHNVRARVAWIQRPHSVREFFQIAVELETPANIWAVERVPGDWVVEAVASHSHASAASSHGGMRSGERFETEIASTKFDTSSREKSMGDMTDTTGASEIPVAGPATFESPLLQRSRRRARTAREAGCERGGGTGGRAGSPSRRRDRAEARFHIGGVLPEMEGRVRAGAKRGSRTVLGSTGGRTGRIPVGAEIGIRGTVQPCAAAHGRRGKKDRGVAVGD